MKNNILRTLFIASALLVAVQTVAAEKSCVRYKALCKQFGANSPWGMQTSITLKGCNSSLIRDAVSVKGYLKKLCTLMKANQHSVPQLAHIDNPSDKSGFSVAQFIERGLISGHFDNNTNSAYISIVTTSPHEATALVDFSKSYFNARDSKTTTAFIQ